MKVSQFGLSRPEAIKRSLKIFFAVGLLPIVLGSFEPAQVVIACVATCWFAYDQMQKREWGVAGWKAAIKPSVIKFQPGSDQSNLQAEINELKANVKDLKYTFDTHNQQKHETPFDSKKLAHTVAESLLENPEFIPNILKLIVDPEELNIAKELISKGLGMHIQLNEKLASKVVGIKVSTLRRDRSKGKGIPYYKHDAEVGLISSKSGKFKKMEKASKARVSYRLKDLLDHMDKRRINPK